MNECFSASKDREGALHSFKAGVKVPGGTSVSIRFLDVFSLFTFCGLFHHCGCSILFLESQPNNRSIGWWVS